MIDSADRGKLLFLGSIAVSPLDLASSYATLASGGVYAEPMAIRRVVLADGTVEVTTSNNLVGTPCFVPGACPRFKDSSFHFGWAAGAGIEYRWGAWSATLDYLHYDLGTLNPAYGDAFSPSFITTSTKFSGDMIRGGINYKFNWTFFDLLTGGARL